MVKLILGVKGKGKTKVLLDKVNSDIASLNGNAVYLDKDKSHMLEINRKVRLIDVNDFGITNSDEFAGFLLGIISQDHDLEKVYIDSLLNVAKINPEDTEKVLDQISAIGEKFNVDFTVVASVEKSQLSDKYAGCVVSE